VIEQEELYDKVEDLQGDQDQGMQDDTLSKTASRLSYQSLRSKAGRSPLS